MLESTITSGGTFNKLHVVSHEQKFGCLFSRYTYEYLRGGTSSYWAEYLVLVGSGTESHTTRVPVPVPLG